MRELSKRIILNNNGSALAMVIIMITILSTLGMAVMTLGVVNYKVGLVDQKAKLSFYMAESGLEQAYGIILNEVKLAVTAGNNAVKEKIDEQIEQEKKALLEGTESEEGETEEGYILFDNGNFIINEDKIKEDLENGQWDDEFKEAYKGYFKATSNLIEKLEDKNAYFDPQFLVEEGESEDNLPEITVVNHSSTDSFFSGGDETILTLCSEYGTSNAQAIPQRVQMDFTISTPQVIPKNYYVNVVKQTLKENPVWNRTLAAFGDIEINDTKEVSGNNLVVLGNIYAGKKFILQSPVPNANISNPVKITGGVAARGNIEIAGDSKGCSLSINGTVCATNLLIAADSITNETDEEKIDNNNITIKGDLYTDDDIEMNGTKVHVRVEGNYYGFSDGSNDSGHDQSSGIVINADDINKIDGSTLIITGNKVTGEDMVFINGVSYIDVKNSAGLAEPYLTGESVSLKGNYRAYSYYLGEASGYRYSYYEPLTLVNEKWDVEAGEWRDLNAADKAKYFKLISEEPHNPSWFNKGLNIELPDAEKIYSLGAYVNKGTVAEKGLLPVSDVEGKAGEYRTRYESSFLNGSLQNYVLIGDEINNKDDIMNTSSEYIFFSRNNDIYLIGSGGAAETTSATKEVKTVNGPLRGIIVTEQDIYLRGELDFSGLIIAGGNIYIEDSLSKTIMFDKEYIRERAGQLGENNPFLDNEEWVEQVYEKNYVGVTESASLNPYKQYISINSWDKITN